MARIEYEAWNPQGKSRDVVDMANAICREYANQGFDLTLRQLYYQFVARGLIRNKQTEYDRLGSLINKARMAGLMDWNFIIDRTRNLQSLAHWESPGGVVRAAARSYGTDLWASQNLRVEVWIEKDALAGVIEPTCSRWDVSHFSCRGYTSQSEMFQAGQRLSRFIDAGQRVVILHLGDHDPSGIDMTRDITERLDTFTTQNFLNDHADDFAADGNRVWLSDIRQAMKDQCNIASNFEQAFEVRRIALTMDQVEEYGPPPNPAKTTDSRFEGYSALYGDESWELDALEPSVLAALIDDAIAELVDHDRYDAAHARQESEREVLTHAAERWPEVATWLGEQEGGDE